MKINDLITKELIQLAKTHKACEESIEWLQEETRTWGELVRFKGGWAVWALVEIPGFEIDLTGMKSYDRVRVMVARPDCPLDLTGMNSLERARVMVARPDCPLDLTGMNSLERARVMSARPDSTQGKSVDDV